MNPARAKATTIYLSIVLALIGLYASCRLLLDEALLLPQMRLDELRLFDPNRQFTPPIFTPETNAAVDSLVGSGSSFHAKYALCRRNFAKGLIAGDVSQAKAAKLQCLDVISAALRITPADGRLWVEKAKLLVDTGGSTGGALDALRNSYVTSAREGWIVVPRLAVLSRLWPETPDDLKEKARSDVDLMLDSVALTRALADLYVDTPDARQVIADLATRSSNLKQERFLFYARQAWTARQSVP